MKNSNIKSFDKKLALFSILSYSFNIGFVHAFPIIKWASTILLCVSYFLLLTSTIKTAKTKKIIKDLVTSFLFIVLGIIFRNADIKNGAYLEPFGICIIFAFFPLFKNNKGWQEIYKKLLKIFFIEHIFFTFFFFIFKDIYINHVIEIFPKAYKKQLFYQITHGEIAGITANFSHNGMYLALSAIYYFSEWLQSDKKKRKQNMLLLLLSFGALLLTGKRAHFVFVIPSILLQAFYKVRKQKTDKAKTLKRILGASMVITGIIILLATCLPGFRTTFDRLEYISQANDITNGRQAMYEKSIKIWKQNPIFGKGWGSVKYTNIYEGNMLNTHNVYIQILAENGIVGETIFVLIIATTINYLFKKTTEENTSASLCIGFIAFFILYCMTGNPLYDEQVLYPALLSISAAISERNKK